MPSGLTFDAGTLSGTPSEAWDDYITVTAGNSGGGDTKSYRLVVKEAASKNKALPDEEIFFETREYVHEEKVFATSENFAVNTGIFDGLEPENTFIVSELGVISVDESGMYDFDVSLDENAETAEKLIWLARPQMWQ